jgi:hypothetical protein
MVVACTYEELCALRAAGLELPDGAFTLHSLPELNRAEDALERILDELRARLEAAILATHPADEEAVATYFDFAHVLGVQARVMRAGADLRALHDLVHGSSPS